jgi:hypothetical protein
MNWRQSRSSVIVKFSCKGVIGGAVGIVGGVFVGGIFCPGLRGFPFRRVITVIKNHFSVFIHQGEAVAPFVGLGILDEGGGELGPVPPVEEKDFGLGDIAIRGGAVETGGDGGAEDVPIRLLVLFAGGLEGGVENFLFDNFIIGNRLRVEFVIGLGVNEGKGQEAAEEGGKEFFHFKMFVETITR